MKKLKTLITAALCLCAVCALCAAPAHALEYTFSAPSGPEYGKSTAFEPVATTDGGAMRNEDLSKSAALIPPGFGTPTSYLPWSGVFLTPDLVFGAPGGGLMDQSGSGTSASTANGGYPTVSPSVTTDSSGITVDSNGYPTVDTGAAWTGGSYIGFTEVTDSMYCSDGSIGTIKIPSIGLTVGVYEGAGDASMLKGAGHFEETSIWDGNCCFAAHNRGVRNDFGKIHTLNTGDIITLTTVYGTRTYAVTGVAKISVNDTSGLQPSVVNMISLYTCVMDQPAYRWCVTATEIGTV